MSEGESASRRASELRQEAAAARAKASELDRQAGAWEAGANGERLAAAELSALPPPWSSVHDRLLWPEHSSANIDHVAVGPPGLFLIDAKHWSGRVTVHDGTLWQHNGDHRSQKPAVDQVCRAAGELERRLQQPVSPVIVLTGTAGRRFSTARVGGVDVVSLAALGKWLRSQPPMLGASEIDSATRRIEAAFPPADATRAGLVPPRHQDTRPTGRHAYPLHRTNQGSTSPRRRPRRSSGLAKFVLILAMLTSAPLVLPILAKAGAGLAKEVLAPGQSQASCRTLSADDVSAVLGVAVKEGSTGSDTRCIWHALNQTVSSVPTVTIQIDNTPLVGKGQDPLVDAQAGRAVARVTKGQSLKAWTSPPPIAPASFTVTLRYAYPAQPTRADRQKADAIALNQVTALAEALARSAPLPQPSR